MAGAICEVTCYKHTFTCCGMLFALTHTWHVLWQDQMHNVGRRSADFQPRRPNFERDRPALDTDLNQHFSRQAAGDSWVRMSEEDEFDWSQRRAVGRADYNLLRSDGSGDGGGDRFRQVMAKGDRVGGKVSRNDSSEEVYAGNNMLRSYRYHKDSRNWDLEPGTQMSFDGGYQGGNDGDRSFCTVVSTG